MQCDLTVHIFGDVTHYIEVD
jgi:hypothetical protein